MVNLLCSIVVQAGTASGEPTKEVVIADCGQISAPPPRTLAKSMGVTDRMVGRAREDSDPAPISLQRKKEEQKESEPNFNGSLGSLLVGETVGEDSVFTSFDGDGVGFDSEMRSQDDPSLTKKVTFSLKENTYK